MEQSHLHTEQRTPGVEIETILDITRHPYDSASILDWAIGIWDRFPQCNLLIITNRGDGAALDNRLRVKLSGMRKQLKHQKAIGVKQFGIHTTFIKWDVGDGTRRDGVCLRRMIEGRHIVTEAFDSVLTQEKL